MAQEGPPGPPGLPPFQLPVMFFGDEDDDVEGIGEDEMEFFTIGDFFRMFHLPAKRRLPAKKPKPKRKKAAPIEVDELSAMINRLPRATLKALILASSLSNTPPTRDAVARELPERQRQCVVPKPSVETAGLLEGDLGYFGLLPAEVQLDIFRLLSLRDRLVCSAQVCKSWKSLRLLPELWTEIDPHVGSGRKYLDMAWINGPGTVKLLASLPKGCVRALNLQCSYCPPDSLKKAFTLTPNLEKLVLNGKKLTPAVMAAAAKSGAVGPATRCISLTDMSSSKCPAPAVQSMLAAAPNLEELELQDYSLNPDTLKLIADAAAVLRSGPCLLRSLHVGHWIEPASFHRVFPHLGRLMPRLERLRIKKLDLFPRYMSVEERDKERETGRVELAPMPCLRSLTVEGMGVGFTVGTLGIRTEHIGVLFRSLHAACGSTLERLVLVRGDEYISGRELLEGRTREAVPKVGSALTCALDQSPLVWPKLQELLLGDIVVDAEDLISLGINAPSLRSLSLVGNHGDIKEEEARAALGRDGVAVRVGLSRHSLGFRLL